MPATLQALQRWAERRLPALTRYRRPEPLPIELHRRRIYIVPTGFGLGFGALLLVMLVGSLNYTNNAALLLTCLLGAAAMSSMLLAFRVLDGVTLVDNSAISTAIKVRGQKQSESTIFNSIDFFFVCRICACCLMPSRCGGRACSIPRHLT